MLWAILLAAATCCAGPLRVPLAGPEQQADSLIRLAKRQLFNQGEPIDATGKGAVISGEHSPLCSSSDPDRAPGGTNNQVDRANPDNLGAQSTDNGVVPNLKWRLSDSRTRIFKGGWIREQVVTDLPASTDLSTAQVHLTKGAFRELHWHSVVSMSSERRGFSVSVGADRVLIHICSPNGASSQLARSASSPLTKMGKIRLTISKWAISGIFPRDKHMEFRVRADDGLKLG